MNFRRKKRSQEHAAADRHAGGGRAAFEHPLVLQDEAELVTTPEALAALVAHIETQPFVAYDTEFIGEESFYPKLCLVQVATAERIALVDPLPLGAAGEGLRPLFRAIAAPGRTVLVHAGDTDMDILRRAAGMEPTDVVDTQVAAALAWMPWPTSLGNVLESLTGHRLGKAHTFTNWDARPLTPAQLGYAADDVRYLALIWHLLGERLDALGRRAWALAESREQLRGAAFDPDGQLRRLQRAEPMRAGQVLVARELVNLRYRLAEQMDLPVRTVLPDASLIELCKRKPTDRGALMQVSGIPRRVLAEHAEEIGAAVARAKSQVPEGEPNGSMLEDPRLRAECDQVWNILQVRCGSIGLAANLAVTRSTFTRWFVTYAEARRHGRALGASEGDSALFAADDWRAEAIGAWFDGFLDGRERLELEWGPSGATAPGLVRPR